MKVVAFIPLRNNSKRISDKNNQRIGSKTLLQHLTDELIHSTLIDDFYIFSSDSSYMEKCNEKIKFLERDIALDSDKTLGIDIYKSFVNKVEADLYVLLHVTSPFLKSKTLDNAVSKVVSGEYDSAFSVEKVKTFAWFNNLPLNYDLNHIVRTQDIEPIYIETSGFYIFQKDLISKNRRVGENPYMEVVENLEAIDIDEQFQLDKARKLYES